MSGSQMRKYICACKYICVMYTYILHIHIYMHTHIHIHKYPVLLILNKPFLYCYCNNLLTIKFQRVDFPLQCNQPFLLFGYVQNRGIKMNKILFQFSRSLLQNTGKVIQSEGAKCQVMSKSIMEMHPKKLNSSLISSDRSQPTGRWGEEGIRDDVTRS